MSRSDDLSLFLFDSWYDMYRGVICLMAVQNGILKQGNEIILISQYILRHENILFYPAGIYLFKVQIQQWKHRTMFEISSSKSVQLRHQNDVVDIVRCLNYWFWTDVAHCSGVSNVDIGQVNSSWVWTYFLTVFFCVLMLDHYSADYWQGLK